eukprot:g4250.t1
MTAKNQPLMEFMVKDLRTLHNDEKKITDMVKVEEVNTVLIFWTTWDQESRKTVDYWEECQKKYKDRVNIIAISIDSEEKAKTIAESREWENIGLTHLCAFDERRVKDAFSIKFVPHLVLVNRDGQVSRNYDDFQEKEVLKLIQMS